MPSDLPDDLEHDHISNYEVSDDYAEKYLRKPTVPDVPVTLTPWKRTPGGEWTVATPGAVSRPDMNDPLGPLTATDLQNALDALTKVNKGWISMSAARLRRALDQIEGTR